MSSCYFLSKPGPRTPIRNLRFIWVRFYAFVCARILFSVLVQGPEASRVRAVAVEVDVAEAAVEDVVEVDLRKSSLYLTALKASLCLKAKLTRL